MKNRFAGEIVVTFSDGYVERCIVKERADKGGSYFLDSIKEKLQLILNQIESEKVNGKVKVAYRGDLARTIYKGLLEVGADKKRLSVKVIKWK